MDPSCVCCSPTRQEIPNSGKVMPVLLDALRPHISATIFDGNAIAIGGNFCCRIARCYVNITNQYSIDIVRDRDHRKYDTVLDKIDQIPDDSFTQLHQRFRLGLGPSTVPDGKFTAGI